MRAFVTGECRAENVYRGVDPAGFREIDFEAEVVKALCCLMPEYDCGSFRGSFILEGERRGADLALIHKSCSHWFVVEVELAGHSLEAHVLPQARCFRFGEPEPACVTSLCNAFPQLSVGQAEAITRHIPRYVAVVANRYDRNWEAALRALDVQLLTVTVFKGPNGCSAHEVEGRLNASVMSLGFGKYSATDRSLRFPRHCGLPLGTIQIEDPFGTRATWTVRDSGAALWITKCVGVPIFPHGAYIQICRTIEGRITMQMHASLMP